LLARTVVARTRPKAPLPAVLKVHRTPLPLLLARNSIMSRSTLIALATVSFSCTWMARGEAHGQPPDAAPHAGSERAQAWLENYDADGDGKLNRQELEAALDAQSRDDHSRSPAGKLGLTSKAKASETIDGPSQDRKFVRVTRGDDGVPKTLETAIARFQSPDGERYVDLIGAIHVGDKNYYRELNRLFRDYDVVLYELIAAEGTRVPRGGGESNHPVGQIQRMIKSVLDLSFQLEEIDYTRPHLVHADMSPEEFAKSMEDRGESFLQIFFRMMGQAASQSGRADVPSDRELLLALLAPDRALQLKRILAGQFEDLEGQMAVFEGPTGSTLISERNKRALDVLRKQQQLGRKSIGIFYGAGHLADMATRLQDDFGLQHHSTRWVRAWDLTGR
jgi:hypothetical protein